MARILVVDDAKAIRLLLTEILLKDKHEVQSVEDGNLAQEKLLQNEFDLVISDLHMRDGDGISVLRASKSKYPYTEVLILTGHGTVSTAVEAMKLGAYEYLTKPIDVQEFRFKVSQALERRDMRLEIETQRREIAAHQQMITRDLKLAEQVQHSLVPNSFSNNKVDVVVHYLPMIGVGGDYADIYFDGKNQVYLTLIDVTGHGITAALLVNRIANEIRRLVRENIEPGSVLYQFNNFIMESFDGTGMFLTMFICRLDLQKRMLTYAGSAHPASILWRREDSCFEKLESQNPIIGFDEAPEALFVQDVTTIHAGDKLIMYTDGIIEAENPEGKPLGFNGMLDIFHPMMPMPINDASEYLIRKIKKWSSDQLHDDVFLLMSGIK